MKRNELPFLILIALSFVLGTGFYAMAADEEELAWFDRVLDHFEIVSADERNNDAKELKDLAGSENAEGEAKPFEHLHLYMYENVKTGPRDAAIKELAKTTPFSRNELEQIILEGDLQVIAENWRAKRQVPVEIETDSGASPMVSPGFESWLIESYGVETIDADQNDANREVNQEQLFNIYNQLISEYEKEFNFQLENRKIVYQAMANELFWDGNKNNSAGIDILYDLDLIHIVMFGTEVPYPEDEDAAVNLASEDMMPLLLREQTEAVAERVAEYQWIQLAEEEASQFSPDICVEDGELREALEAYTAFEESLVDGVDPETGERAVISDGDVRTVSGELDSGGRSVRVAEGSSTAAQDAADEIENTLNAYSQSVMEQSRSLPCGERFCITVTPRMAKWGTTSQEVGTAGAYPETKKCVACHVAYIKQAMDETMSKSLVPGRISTNFFEDPTCKEAGKLINFDLNIYAIPKAIVLDPGNPPLAETQKEIDETVKELQILGGIIETDPTKVGKSLKSAACDSRISIAAVSDLGLNQNELKEMCNEVVEELDDARKEALNTALQSLESGNNENLYLQMSAELSSMLYTFKQFSRGLESTLSPVHSLNTVKKYCQ